MNTIKVFKMSYAYILADKGFTIIDKIPNRNNTKLSVFIFRDSKEIREELNKLIKK